MKLLETAPSSTPSYGLAAATDILALREQLANLVSTDKSQEANVVNLTHEQVKRFTDREKHYKRCETYVGAKLDLKPSVVGHESGWSVCADQKC